MSEIDSDLVLKRWKPTDPKRPPGQYSVRCEGARGLSVKMHKSGTITWVFRFKQHDKQRQMALGPYATPRFIGTTLSPFNRVSISSADRPVARSVSIAAVSGSDCGSAACLPVR